jgi:hypothetical protein
LTDFLIFEKQRPKHSPYDPTIGYAHPPTHPPARLPLGDRGFRYLPELVLLLLLGSMPLHLIAQVPRQTQLWVVKKEFGYTNEIRINNSSPEISIVTLDENQSGPQTSLIGDQKQIIKKGSVWNSRYGFTDYTNWWKYPPETQGFTGMMGGLYRNEVTPIIFHQRKPVTCGWIKANATIDTGAELKKTRADTRIMLRHASAYGSENRGVRIAVTAYYYDWMTGSGWVPAGIIPPDQITVLDQRLDCNGQVILKLGSGDFEVTPKVSGNYQFYEFVVTATPARDHHRTWSYHPKLETAGSPPAKPDRFNLFYVTENDGCICDSDPRLDPNLGLFESTLFKSDSVPVAAELFVYNSYFLKFPNPFGSSTNPDYNGIRRERDADQLLDAPFANIKIVKSMYWDDEWKAGRSQVGGNNMVIIRDAPMIVFMHELGHNVGLRHRDPGPSLMSEKPLTPTSWKINRAERVAFER